jgi:hypothetical protein
MNPLGRLLGPLKNMYIFSEPWKKPHKQSQIPFTYSLLPVSDWLDSLIGPSELLLVVSQLLTVQVLVAGGVGNQLVTKKLGCEKLFLLVEILLQVQTQFHTI